MARRREMLLVKPGQSSASRTGRLRTCQTGCSSWSKRSTHLEDHAHGGAHGDDLAVGQAELLVVIQDCGTFGCTVGTLMGTCQNAVDRMLGQTRIAGAGGGGPVPTCGTNPKPWLQNSETLNPRVAPHSPKRTRGRAATCHRGGCLAIHHLSEAAGLLEGSRQAMAHQKVARTCVHILDP